MESGHTENFNIAICKTNMEGLKDEVQQFHPLR
jgi:hypothetical protein